MGASIPKRVLIGHPFNPVYLLPLVEILAGNQTSVESVERARLHYDDLVMYPMIVRNEIEGYLSDRFQEALWREALHLVNDGIATTQELDDAITHGPGTRWAGMGTNLTFHLAGDQIEEYLLATIAGDRVDCLAMSEPGAGSDVRGMSCTAVRHGDNYIINGTRHFISHADLADYVIVFVATGDEETERGPKKLITCFLVDFDTPGVEVVPGYNSVSNCGYHNSILNFDGVRVDASKMLGDLHRGFEVANEWLGATRLQVASVCLGRAHDLQGRLENGSGDHDRW